MQHSSFPIAPKELIARYEKNLHSAIVFDTMNAHGIANCTLPTYLKPIVPGQKLCGFAYTVKGAPWHEKIPLDEEMRVRAAYMGGYYEDCVPVWDCSGVQGQAEYGEMMSAQSIIMGCRGAIIDGGVRDSERIREMGFRAWYRYTTPTPMIHFKILAWEIPIQIGDVLIRPGDVLFGDCDGVVRVPREMAYDILVEAELKVREEKGWRHVIAEKITPQKALERGVLF